MNRQVELFLAGDVMTGRGIDERLSALRDAKRGGDKGGVIWGDALAELTSRAPELRIVNLETSITTSDDAWPGKRFHFRMHPDNVYCLKQAGFDCCVLANNHVLDFGYKGMADTLDTLRRHGVPYAGAGADLHEAAAPARLELASGRRVLVFAWTHASSFTPREWAASRDRPGINLLVDYSVQTAAAVGREIAVHRQPNDLIVASLHWGPNWGYELRYRQRAFAHALIDTADVDVVHGHSSHHPIAVEIYRGRPILYGCGDLINDYRQADESASFRADLAAMYFLSIDAAARRVTDLTLVPMRIQDGSLRRAFPDDSHWLCTALNQGGPVVGIRDRLRRVRHLRRTRFRRRWRVQKDGALGLRI